MVLTPPFGGAAGLRHSRCLPRNHRLHCCSPRHYQSHFHVRPPSHPHTRGRSHPHPAAITYRALSLVLFIPFVVALSLVCTITAIINFFRLIPGGITVVAVVAVVVVVIVVVVIITSRSAVTVCSSGRFIWADLVSFLDGHVLSNTSPALCSKLPFSSSWPGGNRSRTFSISLGGLPTAAHT